MKLKSILYTPEVYGINLAEKIDEETLSEIGAVVKKEAEIDERSCDEWLKRTEPAMKLAMQIRERKNYPFENSANVKFPLLNEAAIQFQARALSNVIKGNDVVKCKVVGRDAIKDPRNGEWIEGAKTKVAQRVSRHMSWQLMEEMEEWVDDLDKCLTVLPVVGEDWVKTYFCPTLGRSVSRRVPSKNIIINYFSKSTLSPPRITEVLKLYPNEIEEYKRSGFFIDEDIDDQASFDGDDSEDFGDDDRLVTFYEQHRLLDLDEDGYKEPYIVTIHKATEKVVRVYPRYEIEDVKRGLNGKILKIDPFHHYTQRVFFQSPDGGSRGMGFGNLLGPINETINTLINQLIDSGTLYNSNSGFIGKGALVNRGKGHGGDVRFQVGEWKPVNIPGDDLKKAIVPLPVHEPSTVLFSLLGLMIEAGKRTSSIAEVMAGESPGANVPYASTAALIEQGMQVFSGVYGRIHRALKYEFKKLFKLNGIYLDDRQYYRVLDEDNVIARLDYRVADLDVVPVSNPSEVSETQRIFKAQALREVMGVGFNDQEIRRRWAQAMGFEDYTKLILPDEALNQPDPKVVLDQERLALDKAKFEWDMVTDRTKMLKEYAMAMKAMAEAEATEAGPQLEYYKAQLESLNLEAQRIHERRLAKEPGGAGGASGGEKENSVS